MTPEQIEQFRNWGVPLPTRQAHGSDAEIRSNLRQLRPTQWRMAGNRLIGQTEFGELSCFVPTNVILTGTDEDGLPIFKKIV